MNNFCPKCYSDFLPRKKFRKINVRCCIIKYNDLFNICDNCNSELDLENNPDLLKDTFYPLYRKYNNNR